MIRRLLCICLFGAAQMALPLLATPASAAPPPGLPAEAESALQRARVPDDAVAVLVQEVGNGAVRAARNVRTPMNPASVFKLVTTSAALDLLGPAWTWQTPVWFNGSLNKEGVLDGSLIIKGSGDPKLVLERVWLLLRRVRQHGVREIRGDIVLDRSAFSAPNAASSAEFDGEPQKAYNVLSDALLLNYKAVILNFVPSPERDTALVGIDPPLAGVRIDAATITLGPGPCGDWRSGLKTDFSDPLRIRIAGSYPAACGERQWPFAYADPASFNARMLEGLWREMGGSLGGKVVDGVAPVGVTPAFEFASPSLSEVVRDINKYSNNVMAQQLFLTLGLVQRNSGSPEASREVVREWLAERLGSDADGIVIDNGSGLSRQTRVSAQALARLLQSNWSSAVMPELIGSLPVSGLDGTLRRSKAPQGRAHLKTGTLRDAAAVAGYVLSNSGRRYVLVALVNHANAGAPEVRQAFDALVRWTTLDAPSPEAQKR